MIVNCQLSTNNFPRFAEYIGSIFLFACLMKNKYFDSYKNNKH